MNRIDNLYENISGELELVDECVSRTVSGINEYSDNFRSVKDISNYFFSLPGKKLRPALAIFSACAAMGGKLAKEELDNIIIFAAVMELIHSASLIHDDIIDGDTIRRGRPSVNSLYGTQAAVLFGDMIYAEAFVLLTGLKIKNGRVKNRIIRAVSGMSRDMCVGEVEEIRYENRFTMEQYISVIEKKTASLMSVSCRWPALITGSGEKTAGVLADYGYNIGMLYQVIDDCIDGNVEVEGLDYLSFIDKLAKKAVISISDMEKSPYRDKMRDFVEYIKEKI